MVAFALVWGGVDAVVWADPIDTFPFYKGIAPIMLSWFIAPVLAVVISAGMFLINRYLVNHRARLLESCRMSPCTFPTYPHFITL